MNTENIERTTMEECLNKELRPILIRTRERLGVSQAKMARRYFMAKNTYSDLEAGKHGFGSLTIVLLLKDQEDPAGVILFLFRKMQEALAEVTIQV